MVAGAAVVFVLVDEELEDELLDDDGAVAVGEATWAAT